MTGLHHGLNVISATSCATFPWQKPACPQPRRLRPRFPLRLWSLSRLPLRPRHAEMSTRMILVDGMASERQYEAPIVLGMISESTRIRSVRMTEITPKYSSPKSFIDSAPTPAEPMVWAMVLSERIAPTGRSTLFLYRFIKEAVLLPWFSFIEMNDIGVDRSTASRTEHKKDSARAPVKYKMIKPINKNDMLIISCLQVGDRQLTTNEGPYDVCVIGMSFTTQRYLFSDNHDVRRLKHCEYLTKRLRLL